MVEYVNDCNGCPECRFCGRYKSKTNIYRCDYCGDEFDPKDLKKIGGEHVCLECYIEMAQGDWDDAESVEE